jgi:hypothetical protein
MADWKSGNRKVGATKPRRMGPRSAGTTAERPAGTKAERCEPTLQQSRDRSSPHTLALACTSFGNKSSGVIRFAVTPWPWQ